METESKSENKINIQKMEGLEFLQNAVENKSVDLILTDPPYIISKETGMDKHFNTVKENEEEGIEFVKTETEWDEYKTENDIDNDEGKQNYLRYGSIYGKKYAVKTDYGDWDKKFTLELLEKFVEQYYKKLRNGGTLILFLDLWKITPVKELLEKYKFKQIRMIEWIKTNPQPLNSKVNYLTNCREIALVAIKVSKPTFNSSYDKGIYEFPLQGGKIRSHPTQKSLPLFEELIRKHSNPGDLVLDTFLGAGTTAMAAKNTDRRFLGCEVDDTYYATIQDNMNQIKEA